jgi:hypothetical protein
MANKVYTNNPNYTYTPAYDYDDTFSSKKTIKKPSADDYPNNVPNPLFKYASYNVIFTLSALTQAELEDPQTLLKGTAHDIIARSAGIGNPNPTEGGLSAENKAILKSDKATKSLRDAQENLRRGRDLYFSKVRMFNLPSLNAQRRLTSVTNIEMDIIEPMGISLLDKIRGAAANCNYLDHISAPYLLTMEFRGFDEFGKPISEIEQEMLKRKIPIKLVNMKLDVNKGGTTYSVKAVPMNEHGFVNHHIYLRTSGVIKTGNNIQDTMDSLAAIMNKQTEDEKKQQLVEIADTYEIIVDPEFANEKPSSERLGMGDIAVGGQSDAREAAILRKAGQVKQNDSLLVIMTELMKSLPRFQRERSLNNFKAKIEKAGKDIKPEEMYFDYFFIDSSVVPDSSRFDRVRGKHPRKIIYNIVPYKIHAYALVDPGASTGTNFEQFVKKTYNYIFTGDNLDILDLNINYRVAYFQTRLKDIEGKSGSDKFSRESGEQQEDVEREDPSTKDPFREYPYIHQSEVGTTTSVTSGINKGNSTELDQRLDALSNPTADMVSVRMSILGDPAYLGQSQFIPTTASRGDGTSNRKKLAFSQGNRDIWNEIYGNYNMGFGDVVIKLNFRSPTDVNEKTGVYELAKDEQIAFSGLYRVVQVDNMFEDGKFVQELQLVRFNNQGDRPYTPQASTFTKPNPHVDTFDGLVSKAEYVNEVSLVKEKFSSYLEGKIKLLKAKFNIGRN